MQKIALLSLLTSNVLLSAQTIVAEAQSLPPEPVISNDYSFSYWLNGMRKNHDDSSAAILCFETGQYGFTLDIEDFSQSSFGPYSDKLSYGQALASGAARLDTLEPAELAIELEINGEVYKAIGCLPGLGTHATYPEVARQYDAGEKVQHLDARLWESGRFVQHYDLLRLKFENDKGHQLSANALLDIVAWPDSLTLTAEIKPEYEFLDGSHNGIDGRGLSLIEKPWNADLPKAVSAKAYTIECWVSTPKVLQHPREGWLISLSNSADQVGAGFELKYGKATAVLNPAKGTETREIKQLSYAPLPDRWNHLVLTYDGEQMHFYLNGALQGSESIEAEDLLDLNKVHLGAFGANELPVKGLFDQLRIWDRALTAEEVTTHSKKPSEIASRTHLSFEENFENKAESFVPQPIWKDAQLSVQFITAHHKWQAASTAVNELSLGESKRVTLNCNLHDKTTPSEQLSIQLSSLSDGQKTPVSYNAEYNSYVAEVKKVQRDWKTGYTDIRDYDEFEITVENFGDATEHLPLLFYLRDVANPTGLCPILCDADGVPLGIPVQLSKNWHDASLGVYVRAYMRLPAEYGSTSYRLRIPYGFYGTLPSASHAMLSLVGYGGLGRWHQLSIGCWGESICFDMDMSCVDNTVTDVRMLMGRNGLKGGKWNWTDAAWGGDWLGIFDPKGQKHFFSELKTAYLAHGPCLSEVRYDGCYGSQREANIGATLKILRTDDFVRTFQTISYEFNTELSVQDSWLFKMGGGIRSISTKIAYGNADGLIKAADVPSDLEQGEFLLDKITLTGDGPWWVGFPGGYTNHDKDWGTGSRGLIIRDYKASFSGKTYSNPTISMYALIAHPDGRKNIDLVFVPPAGVESYQEDDRVDMDIEWITLPRIADDYYGPNEAFRTHLTEHPASWKTIHRQASGNDLKVSVEGGQLIKAYPVLIRANEDLIKVTIEGGVGAVPIRFEGLPTALGYTLYNTTSGEAIALDQSVQGNDFWQTDYDSCTKTYRITYNLPLDGLEHSFWELRRK